MADGAIGVRDSKHGGGGPTLIFSPKEWTAFLEGVAQGEFDLDELAH